MAERVALITSINNDMLNESFELFTAGVSKETARERLDDLIAQVYTAKENIGKTRVVVQNLWYDSKQPLHDVAIEAAANITRSERLPVHWALLLTQYKVFFDLCNTLGCYFELRDVVSTKTVKAAMGEKWGARSSVLCSVTRTFKTLCDMDTLERIGTSSYLKKSIQVSDPKIVALLFTAVMLAAEQQNMTWESFITHPAIFPFVIKDVTQADIAAAPYLAMERMGEQVVFRMKE